MEKFLKEAVTIVVGKQAEDIVDLLDSKKYVNEFILAKKLDITINQTRNILYKLSDQGFVSSMRKKDKKKGWYTYFWKIEVLKSLEFLKNILKKRVEQIDSQIKSRETKQFYICEKCNIEFTEENALTNNFTCNECGDIFTLKDNSKVLRELNRQKDKLEKELELIEVEINKEVEKIEKFKEKERKKIEKEKAIIKEEKRKAAAKKRGLKKKVVNKVKRKIKEKTIKKKIKKVVKKKMKSIKKFKGKVVKKKIGKKKSKKRK